MIQTTLSKVSYNCDGVNKVFAYPFAIHSEAHIRVRVATASGTTGLSLGSGFKVLPSGTAEGGFIETTVAPAAAAVISIYRETPRFQLTDLRNNDTYDAEAVELALDKLTMITQEIVAGTSSSGGSGGGTVTTPPGDADALWAAIWEERDLRVTEDGVIASVLEGVTAALGEPGDPANPNGSLYARVTEEKTARATALGYLFGQYVLKADVNGRIASMALTAESDPNGWTTTSIKFLADAFHVYNGSTDVPVFSVDSGQLALNGAITVAGKTLTTLATNAQFPSINFIGSFAAAPDPTPYPINSLYRNSTDSNVYIKTNAGNWALYTNAGAAGIQGPVGPVGPTGPAGAKGDTGATGTRGSKNFYRTIAGTAWSNTEADNAITSAGLTKVLLDQVTLSNNTSWAETRFWDGAAWATISMIINGNLLVKGTVGADRLVADSITGTYIAANVELRAPKIMGGKLVLDSAFGPGGALGDHVIHGTSRSSGIRFNGGDGPMLADGTSPGSQIDLRGIDATASDARGTAYVTAGDLGTVGFTEGSPAGAVILRTYGTGANGLLRNSVDCTRDGKVKLWVPSNGIGSIYFDVVGNSLVCNVQGVNRTIATW